MLDTIMKNGKIVDGSGNPWFKGDVGIKNGKIHMVCPNIQIDAKEILDVKGQVIAPGFIDPHSHLELDLMEHPKSEVMLRQGVTTVIVGNCGLAPVPVSKKYYDILRNYLDPLFGGNEVNWDWGTYDEFLDRYKDKGIAINIAFLAAHGSIRIAAMGFKDDIPSKEELESMKKTIKEAMKAGFMGMSTGLSYIPGRFANKKELTELAKVVAEYNGVYVSHIRSQSNTLIEAVNEVIDIGKEACIPVHISHLKPEGKVNWDKTQEVLEIIKSARDEGVDVTCDMYPYIAGSTFLSVLLPPWVLEGGNAKAIQRLNDPVLCSQVKDELSSPTNDWDNLGLNSGWDSFVISSVNLSKNKCFEGKNILQIAEETNSTPQDVVIDLFKEEKGQVLMIEYLSSETAIKQILKSDFTMIGSDGVPVKKGKPHPRLYGTFPRLLAKYVREEKVISLENAIKKITSMPANRFNIHNRGYIKPGMFADITVFDPEIISDNATYLDPCQFPKGINHVFINGKHVLKYGVLSDKYFGKILNQKKGFCV